MIKIIIISFSDRIIFLSIPALPALFYVKLCHSHRWHLLNNLMHIIGLCRVLLYELCYKPNSEVIASDLALLIFY